VNRHIWQILVCASLLGAAAHAAPKLAHTHDVGEKTRNNTFQTKRIATLKWYPEDAVPPMVGQHGTYETRFGERFMRDLESLSPDKTWIDLGAGGANAQLGTMDFGKKSFRAIAVGYKHPNRKQRVVDEKAHPSFKYIEGDFHAHSIKLLGGPASADLVTGVVALGIYNTEWDQLITKVGTVLKPGAHYYETTYTEDLVDRWYKGGKIVDRSTFFNNIRGLRLVEDRRHSYHPGEAVMVFERTNEPLEVPKLKGTELEYGHRRWDILSDVKPVEVQGEKRPGDSEYYREP
jgi:hypothetical protein